MKTKNLAVSGLIAVLTLALWYNFLLKPSRSEASKVKAETETEKSKLPPLQAQLAQANNDAAHAGTFKARLAALKHAVPETPELANFIRDANGIAVASGIQWQSVTHGVPTPGEAGTASIAVGIQIKGTYEQVVDYLTRISSLRRLLVLDSVPFTSAATNTAAPGAGATPGAAPGVGESTGPFSGGSQLSVTIAARMFDTPAALAVAPDATAATAPAA
jgi:Tfp pilus assembly protein PilO